MQWAEVIDNPNLQDLPFKIELNKWGNIEMTPASNWHSSLQARILVFLCNTIPSGEAFTECSIQTPEGVKVPDVIWGSTEFFDEHGYTTPYLKAPQLCIEVLSPSNSRQEMTEKVQLYLAQGALEVWLVDPDGTVRFYTQQGQQHQSAIVKALPSFLHAASKAKDSPKNSSSASV